MAGYSHPPRHITFENRSNGTSDLQVVLHPSVTAHMRAHTFMTSLLFDGIYSLGCIANVLLVTYIIKYRRYRSPIFAVIMSLGISDINNCAAAVVWVTFRMPFVLGPDWVCNVSTFTTFISTVASNYNIAFISVIRFYQLVFPLSAHVNVTSRLVAKIASLIWINSFLIAVSYGIVNGTMQLKDSRGDFKVCLYIGDHQYVYDVSVAMWVHLLPLVTTVVLQFVKHCIVSKQVASAQLAEVGGAHAHARESTDTRAVVIVVSVYIVTTLPLVGIFLVFLITSTNHAAMTVAADIINKIYFINSALNPFIYAFAAHTVRNDILKMHRFSPPGNKEGR